MMLIFLPYQDRNTSCMWPTWIVMSEPPVAPQALNACKVISCFEPRHEQLMWWYLELVAA